MDRETADALDALVDGLRARADPGDRTAAERLTELLGQQGHGEEAQRLCRFGLASDGSTASR
jgi:hypothetical protein